MIEIVVVMGLLAIFLPALTDFVVSTYSSFIQSEAIAEANFLAQEYLEAARSIREDSWQNLANGAYKISANSNGKWILTADPVGETVGNFTRKIVISDVCRDSSDALVACGVSDPSSKKMVVTVSWSQPISRSVSYTIYSTRYLNNNKFIHTTQAEFDAGTKNNVVTTNNSGGEVRLATSGGGSPENIYTDALGTGWTFSNIGGNTTDLNNTNKPIRTGAKSLLTKFAASGEIKFSKSFNTAGFNSFDFYIDSVAPWTFAFYSNTGGAPTGSGITLTNSFSGYASYTYNSYTTIFPTPNYASFKSEAQSSGIYVNAGSSNYTISESDLAGYANKLVYVEFSDTARRLTIDFGSFSGRSYTASIVTNTTDVRLQNYNSTTLNSKNKNIYPALLGAGAIQFSANNNFTISGFIFSETGGINDSSISSPQVLTVNGSVIVKTFDTNFRNANVNYNYATALDNPTPPSYFTPNYYGQDFKVKPVGGSPTEVNMSSYLTGGPDKDPTSWQLVSIPLADMNIASATITSISMIENATTARPTLFFDDILFASSSGGFVASGDFTSTSLDTVASSAFNTLAWNPSSQVASTDLKAQIATNNDNATWNYKGPDCSAGTYYTISASASYAKINRACHNNNRYLRYKFFFSTTDSSKTPELYDVTINYSP